MFDMLLGMLGSGASSLGTALGGQGGSMPFSFGKPPKQDEEKDKDPAATAQAAPIQPAQRPQMDLQTLMAALQKRTTLGTGGMQ
jgi:hypothetical protein